MSSDPWNHGSMIHLDAETLAEQGLKEAYEELLPRLRELGIEPEPVTEVMDADAGRYSIRFRGADYPIYAPELPDQQGSSWGRATHVFFTIVNSQLSSSPRRFYALYGGNDLGGMFLTDEELAAAKTAITRKTDRPYIPTSEAPWFGQEH